MSDDGNVPPTKYMGRVLRIGVPQSANSVPTQSLVVRPDDLASTSNAGDRLPASQGAPLGEVAAPVEPLGDDHAAVNEAPPPGEQSTIAGSDVRPSAGAVHIENEEPLPPVQPQAGKTATYTVGKGKPPKEHQFPKNTSGNPKGRPKGSQSLKVQLKLIIGQLVAVTENGKRSKRSTIAVLLMKLRADALAGQPKARDQLIKLIVTQLPDEVAHDHSKTAAEDEVLLAKFKAQMK